MLSSGEFWESNAAKGKAKPTEEQAVMLREMDTEDEERGELARQAEVVREGWNAPILRESCDKYARDYGWLKEFRMKREVWGWDMSGLETGESRSSLDDGVDADSSYSRSNQLNGVRKQRHHGCIRAGRRRSRGAP